MFSYLSPCDGWCFNTFVEICVHWDCRGWFLFSLTFSTGTWKRPIALCVLMGRTGTNRRQVGVLQAKSVGLAFFVCVVPALAHAVPGLARFVPRLALSHCLVVNWMILLVDSPITHFDKTLTTIGLCENCCMVPASPCMCLRVGLAICWRLLFPLHRWPYSWSWKPWFSVTWQQRKDTCYMYNMQGSSIALCFNQSKQHLSCSVVSHSTRSIAFRLL